MDPFRRPTALPKVSDQVNHLLSGSRKEQYTSHLPLWLVSLYPQILGHGKDVTRGEGCI